MSVRYTTRASWKRVMKVSVRNKVTNAYLSPVGFSEGLSPINEQTDPNSCQSASLRETRKQSSSPSTVPSLYSTAVCGPRICGDAQRHQWTTFTSQSWKVSFSGRSSQLRPFHLRGGVPEWNRPKSGKHCLVLGEPAKFLRPRNRQRTTSASTNYACDCGNGWHASAPWRSSLNNLVVKLKLNMGAS